MDNDMDLSIFEEGMRIVIQLKSGQIFEGHVIKARSKRIYIHNIMEYPSRQILRVGILIFYAMEIVSVKLLGYWMVPGFNERFIIQLSKEFYERLMDIAIHYTYLPVMDRNYITAIKHIKKCDTIGVVGVFSKHGRFDMIKYLVISSHLKIYIFDLEFYHKRFLPKCLQAILETPGYPQKIVHDSQKLNDCLFHMHKVKMRNIFDTQIMDVELMSKVYKKPLSKYKNLTDCLFTYFNFPAILDDALKVPVKQWKQRPLTSKRKFQLARLVVYLLPLKERQEKLAISSLYSSITKYAKGLSDLPSLPSPLI